MTGIELSADSCVLADVRRGSGLPRLSAVHVVEAPAWPPEGLARVRRRKHFSSHANVVAWTSDESALRPLRQAGFTVDAVLTPEQALGILALERARPQTGAATAWLALARHGAAIVIARGPDILYSRRIEWRYKAATRLNEQLLQRYSLVAHLAPELQHGIEVVRAEHGIEVDCAVTCGDLPDLRSLTMPLIEELDLEVETLDSLDGLDATPTAEADGALDYASALRLACAVTAVPPMEAARRSRRWTSAAAVGVLAIIAVALWMVVAPESPSRSPVAPRVVPDTPSPAATAGSAALEPAVVALSPRSDEPARRPIPPEPLPAVSSILFGGERRLAIVNGVIVGEGASVGGRRVLRIEREAVVLREPGGGDVRVGVRRLKPAPQH